MENSLNDRIGDALARLSQVVRSLGWRAATDAGVNPTQVAVLGYLLRGEASRIGDIAADMGVSQPTITDSVAALERKGLVEKRPDPADGRGRVLVLTKAGRKLAAELGEVPPGMHKALAGLSLSEREGLIVGLTRLMQQLDHEGVLLSAKVCFSCKHSRANVPGGDPYYCALMQAPLRLQDLRVHCPEHEVA